MKLRQSHGNNSAITANTQMKLHVHDLTMVIYAQCKFHERPSIDCLVMAEDRKTDGRRNQMDRQRKRNIPMPSAVDNKTKGIMNTKAA